VSAHLTPEALWEAARVPPEGDEYAHLQLCPDCRLELDNIKLAQSALVEPPLPPPLSDASARRIGNVLRKAAEKQARRSLWYGGWWPFGFSPTWALAPVAAVVLAFFAYRLTSTVAGEPQQAPIARHEAEPVQPTPPPMPEAPKPLPAQKVLASVKSSKNAKSGTAVLKKAQQLREGSVVATAKGGSLLMALPDGSQLGLDGASQVQLAKLEDHAVTVDVDKGSLKVLARHDPARELRVRAGDLEVFDVGTEFIVSRDAEHTLVGVQEGEVEVRANGENVPVRAGQAVEWRGGKLLRQKWAEADELPKPRPPAPARRASEPPASKKMLADDTPEIPAEAPSAAPPAAPAAEPQQPKPSEPVAANEPPPASNPNEWDTPPNLKDAPTLQPPPVPQPQPPPEAQQPPAAAPTAPSPATEEEEDNSLKARIEREVNKIKNVFRAPSRIARADQIANLASRGQCNEAISLADAWLTEAVPKGESFHLRRSVLSSKLRCLNYQGRTGDAAAVQRELDHL
jgi:hypothetical protein